jgi:hypothetical protein
MNKVEFRNRVDKELGGMDFSSEAKKRVLNTVKRPGSRLSIFLNMELRIPVQPFAAALLIAATVMVYVVVSVTRVTPEEVQKSTIVFVENSNGRHENDIYKD